MPTIKRFSLRKTLTARVSTIIEDIFCPYDRVKEQKETITALEQIGLKVVPPADTFICPVCKKETPVVSGWRDFPCTEECFLDSLDSEDAETRKSISADPYYNKFLGDKV